MSNDVVTINITAETVAVTQAGFGMPLILSADVTFQERIRFYDDILGVAADVTATKATYLAAQAIFAQSPRVERIAIGRLALKPTQKWTLDLGSLGILNSTRYRIQVTDALGNTQNADFTTDANATEAELWAGLDTAFNALVGPTATAVNTGPNTSLVITGDTAGAWHAICVINPDGQYDSGGEYMSIVQDHADPGVATDLAAIAAVNSDWYAIYNLYNSEAMATAIAGWAQSAKKLFMADVQDSATVSAAVGGTDFADDFKDSGYAYAPTCFHPNPAKMAGAAYLGKRLPEAPGSETWKFAQLAGVDTYPLTATHKVNLRAKRCNFYHVVGGVAHMAEGVVPSTTYRFIDFVRGLDWLEARMSERVFGTFVSSKKIPQTNRGIAVVEGDVRAQLQEGVQVGFLSDDTPPVVTVPKIAAVSDADKAARILRNVKFQAVPADAFHNVIINGSVSF